MKLSKATKFVVAVAAGLAFTVAAGAQSNDPSIAQRKENQQDRISQGVKSGQLTAGETGHLEKKEAGINRETRNMRAADGGKLTPADKRIVNRQQNKVSRQIYRDKHNNRKQ